MRWPLRNQILFPMLAVVFIVLAAATTLNVYLSVARTRSRIEGQVRAVAATLASASFPPSRTVLIQMRALSGAEFVVADRSGNVLAASDSQGLATGLTPPEPGPEHSFQLVQPVEVGPLRYFHSAVALPNASGPYRNALLHIYYPESSYEDAWREAAYPPLAVGAAGGLLVFLLAALIAARVGGPLARLRQQVDQIAGGDFRPLPLPTRNDEIRDLAAAFNRMAEMLALYEEKVRAAEQLRTLGQLGGGIAHQLRNSVTGCRMALDLHRRQCSTEDCESLEVALRQLTLMEKYIRRFLDRARGGAAELSPVELQALLARTLPLLTPSARHVGVDVQLTTPAFPVIVEGDDEDLEQMVVNLVLNAIDAAAHREACSPLPSGAGPGCELPNEPIQRLVRVTLSVADDRVVLEVADSGKGPEPHVQNRMFEPLVTGKPDGAGLGLFIARDVAQRHGGRIHWHRRNSMTSFVVELPTAQPQPSNASKRSLAADMPRTTGGLRRAAD
jgi:signal transduction histidine kinase